MKTTLVVTLLALCLLAGTAFSQPLEPAPTPTEPAAEVTSLFSNVYTNAAVDTWSADWDMADVADVQIEGDDTKLYTNLVFAGIEFTSQPIDASGHEFFHMDIWTPDPTELPAVYNIKLVDFGPDGVWGGGDDSEFELGFTADSGLMTDQWVEFDIPLDDFTGLTNTSAIAQLIISGDPNTVYIDNIYFSGGAGQTEPGSPAPTPTEPAEEVISLFSNAYENVLVDTWSTDWDMADVADVQIQGNDAKLYTNTVFAGVEFTSQPLDVTDHTHFHMDYWTPEPTDLPAVFKIKLVDFGADGVWGGGDDTEHELTFDATTDPAIMTGQWVGFDIPLDDFVGMTGRSAVAQLIFVSDPGPNTVYIDNVYFHGQATPPAPVELVLQPAGATQVTPGGNLFFNITVSNNTNSSGTVTLFTEAVTPAGGTVGPLLNVTGLTLPANHTFTFTNLAQAIPANAPSGTFTYVCKVQYGPMILAQGEFEFEIVPALATTGSNTDWSVSGVEQFDNLRTVTADETELPLEQALLSAYPNPFNPVATVQLSLPTAAEVQVVVHNSLGREVATLARGAMSAGSHALTFDGSALASGLYFVRATVDGRPLTMQKLMLLK